MKSLIWKIPAVSAIINFVLLQLYILDVYSIYTTDTKVAGSVTIMVGSLIMFLVTYPILERK